MMGDMKRRIWFRNTRGNERPDISVLLLIDGSGSMHGDRRNSAMISSVILHEVLRKQSIQHAIVEHRGHFYDPEILSLELKDISEVFYPFYILKQLMGAKVKLTSSSDNYYVIGILWVKYCTKFLEAILKKN